MDLTKGSCSDQEEEEEGRKEGERRAPNKTGPTRMRTTSYRDLI